MIGIMSLYFPMGYIHHMFTIFFCYIIPSSSPKAVLGSQRNEE
jgi:hypothetical protein